MPLEKTLQKKTLQKKAIAKKDDRKGWGRKLRERRASGKRPAKEDENPRPGAGPPHLEKRIPPLFAGAILAKNARSCNLKMLYGLLFNVSKILRSRISDANRETGRGVCAPGGEGD